MSKKPTFGICSPSSYVRPDWLDQGIQKLGDLEHEMVIHPQTYGRLGQTQLGGTVEERVSALYDLCDDPKVDIVMPSTGGQGSTHLLDKIDFKKIKKPICGYSDTTALINAAYAQTGIVQYHGPHVTTFRSHRYHEDMYNIMHSILNGMAENIFLTGSTISKPGVDTGRLIGGNLIVFQHLLHTAWCPDLDGAILFFEDVGDELSSIDRTLNYFRLLGLFDRAAGLIFGQFTDMKDTGRPFGFTVDEIIANHTRNARCPIVTNAPFGHGGLLTTFPVGAVATLDARQGTPTLTLAK